MKMTFSTIGVAGFFVAGSAIAQTNSTISPDRVSFYDVPFVCPAAKEIGCGSRTKPLLIALEQKPTVAEAWLNRGGTIMAVVWKADAKEKDRASTIKDISKEEEFEAKELSRTAKKETMADFLKREGWLRGGDVDRLSEEEAGVIAARWMKRLKARTTLSGEKTKGLNDALTESLKQVLTGKLALPETEEAKAIELKRIAGPFLDDKQLAMLGEAVGCGLRAMPGEE